MEFDPPTLFAAGMSIVAGSIGRDRPDEERQIRDRRRGQNDNGRATLTGEVSSVRDLLTAID